MASCGGCLTHSAKQLRWSLQSIMDRLNYICRLLKRCGSLGPNLTWTPSTIKSVLIISKLCLLLLNHVYLSRITFTSSESRFPLPFKNAFRRGVHDTNFWSLSYKPSINRQPMNRFIASCPSAQLRRKTHLLNYVPRPNGLCMSPILVMIHSIVLH